MSADRENEFRKTFDPLVAGQDALILGIRYDEFVEGHRRPSWTLTRACVPRCHASSSLSRSQRPHWPSWPSSHRPCAPRATRPRGADRRSVKTPRAFPESDRRDGTLRYLSPGSRTRDGYSSLSVTVSLWRKSVARSVMPTESPHRPRDAFESRSWVSDGCDSKVAVH